MPVKLEEYAAAWAEGWTRTRGTPAPVEVPEGRYIAVGRPDHHGRYVVAGLSGPEIRRLAGTIEEPWTYIKALAGDAFDAEECEGWTVQAPEFLMATELGRGTSTGLPAGYRVDVSERDGCAAVGIFGADDAPAAGGKAAIAGRFLVFDQIVTDPAHRRRGLGRCVMQALTEACGQSGPDRGLLVATAEGRALYEATGWRIVSPVVSLLRR